ncbi:MAG: aminotransferase class V-fold PLP-dependent enzyme [Microthrixaceae bacterium]
MLRPTQALGGATVAVDRFGRVDLTALAEMVRTIGDGHTGGSYTGGSYTGGSYTGGSYAENSRAPGVSVVSVMTANNELGTINDISAVAEVVRRHAPGVPLHAMPFRPPWLDLRSVACEADLVSVSAHKLGGPKGTGALVVRRPHTLAPLLHGGGQERDRRGGTHNVAGIVGFAAALIAAARRRPASVERIGALRDSLAKRLVALDGVTETIDRRKASTLPGHCHLLSGWWAKAPVVAQAQRGVCASAASSCASGAIGASHVLEAIGVVDPDVAPVRLTLGADSTPHEVDRRG